MSGVLLSLPNLATEVWNDSDPFVSTLFAAEKPWTFLSVLSLILVMIKRTEISMKYKKEPSWVKPVLLILYGLNFGINGAGFLLSLAATDNGKDCFRCLDRNELNILTISMRYLIYAYVCTLLLVLWMKTLEARQHRTPSNLLLIKEIIWLVTSFIALKFVPVGYYAFCPIVHCVLRTIDYGVKVLQSASPELNFIGSSWNKKMKVVETLAWCVLCAHQFWVYCNLQCDRSWANLMGASVAGVQAVFTLLDE